MLFRVVIDTIEIETASPDAAEYEAFWIRKNMIGGCNLVIDPLDEDELASIDESEILTAEQIRQKCRPPIEP
jgi:glutaredoxin-related protein